MNIAIIAAAGQGTRLGGSRPKQFLELAGVPIIIHTLRRFERCAAIQEVILVVPREDVTPSLALAETYDLRKLARVVEGGPTRAESVRRGLQSVDSASAEIIAVHDGVRPFVTPEEIDRTVHAARISGAAILTAPASDTIKEVENDRVVRTLARGRWRRALTPQCFHYELLRAAYEQSSAFVESATDDSSLVESLGTVVTAVEGDPRNIKITRPEDIALGEILLRQESELRTQKSE